MLSILLHQEFDIMGKNVSPEARESVRPVLDIRRFSRVVLRVFS